MNTITRIENALSSINDAKFEKLMYHLLYLQGNTFMGAPGAVKGKEKTSKGTPDAFFVNDDKFIFVECTTQARLGKSKSFFEKLSKDVDHCFNEFETKIEKGKIEKVILACTEKINTNEYKQLYSKVKSYNDETKLEVFNIQNLPLLIFDNPQLAEEYLNIQIVKGDIYTLKEFLLKTEKGLQPSLTNEFIGREEELKNIIEALKKYDILLLSGGAGVGKSKLAVKILEELSKDDYVPIVIQSSGVSLWDDYQHLFLFGKKHIILFDDANKSISNLNYLLSKIEAPQSYSVKVIVTSRDYVKKQVSITLENYLFKEFNIPEFKDEEIGKIIVAALPNLQYHSDIKIKIMDLAKGNARVALMATYSVTPHSETNYLSSPVLLYEKYFKKISEEIGIFNNPIILKSLAIVSFFGVLDRSNKELNTILSNKFDIDWNELWTAIMELHNSEIVDVYSNEIVKVSDQVLASYSFYKCFIDDKSAVINYAEWIATFIEKFSYRIRATLIDVNNTFDYYHVRDLVLPHLNKVIKQINADEELYAFYDLFWYYKGRDCLLYLKKWIENLSEEQYPDTLKFSYVHNDHSKATKHFELLKDFWNHPNELLKPSLELTLALLNKQPSRLPEILKFIHEDFKYRLKDIEHGYLRQNILLDILLDDKIIGSKKEFVDGIFLNISETLLGWHYTEFKSKGNAYSVYNFDLYKSAELINLRGRILNQVFQLFGFENEQLQKILHRIIYSGGDIDKSIHIDELPIYQKIISDKLDFNQYTHCKFVSVLAQHLTNLGIKYPENWNVFIESDIKKISKFFNLNGEYFDNLSFDESENKKQIGYDDFVKVNDWRTIEIFLLNIMTLHKQQKVNNSWNIEWSINEIYVTLARINKSKFEKGLRLYFSGNMLFSLEMRVVNIALYENIMTGEEILNLLNDYEFQEKLYWKSVLVAMLPEEQVNELFLELLINIFKKTNENIYINRIIHYQKYGMAFDEYKKGNSELKNHNIITYLTSVILSKTNYKRYSFREGFCASSATYFISHIKLLKDVYWAMAETITNFDSHGQELKSILDYDKNFIKDNLKNGKIGLGYSSAIRLENINTNILWEYDEYEELIENILTTILDKENYQFYISEDDIYSLFTFRNDNNNLLVRAKSFITKLTQKYISNDKIILMLIEIVYNNFNNWFIEYFKEFLFLNKDIEITKQISFGRSSSTSGSWVPVYQKKIEFYYDILKMINNLPNILDYSQHIDYFEQLIAWKKLDIEREQKSDFMDEFY